MDTVDINQTVVTIPWETVDPGPSGEYIEVVDHDPASGCFYAPVDLNDTQLIAADGLAPAEGNPKFHQQMVYAVAMRTIHTFEEALGRKALWSPRMDGVNDAEYVQKLRLYPHALRDRNAYYNPLKKALLFGYFPARPLDPGSLQPGGMVFTCLSHDIVAHETAHALLDGMARGLVEPTNLDMLAFHEAFADVIALFQHFTLPGILEHQIGRVRGDLRDRNLLGELAQQFGLGYGLHGALRSYIGRFDAQGHWERTKPSPTDYARATEQHERGAVLVAAIFDAFLSIYERRIADLKRIASEGTGILRAGDLHPDLVRRFADEARKAAVHVLQICIRAIDYCPPVDLTFGDFLRAAITADADLFPDDVLDYRVALMESFRERGIYPNDVRTMSEDALRWKAGRRRICGLSAMPRSHASAPSATSCVASPISPNLSTGLWKKNAISACPNRSNVRRDHAGGRVHRSALSNCNLARRSSDSSARNGPCSTCCGARLLWRWRHRNVKRWPARLDSTSPWALMATCALRSGL